MFNRQTYSKATAIFKQSDTAVWQIISIHAVFPVTLWFSWTSWKLAVYRSRLWAEDVGIIVCTDVSVRRRRRLSAFSPPHPHTHNPQAGVLWMVTNQFKVLRREPSGPGRNEWLITAPSHYPVTWRCQNNRASLKASSRRFERLALLSSVALTHSLCLSKFTAIVWKFTLLVWWQPCTFSLLPFYFLFLSSSCVAPHQRSREGPFVSDFAPKAVILQGRLIITEYTTSGKTISTSLMSNMRETKITKKKKGWRGKVLKDGLSFCLPLSWQYFLLLLRSTVSQYIKNIKEDLKERGVCPWRAVFEKWHGNYSLWQRQWRWEGAIYNVSQDSVQLFTCLGTSTSSRDVVCLV